MVVYRVRCTLFNRNFHQSKDFGRPACARGFLERRGWWLDTIDPARAVADGRVHGPGVGLSILTFPSHDGREGNRPLDGGEALLVAARRLGDIVLGRRDFGTAFANLLIPRRGIPPARGPVRPLPPRTDGPEKATTHGPRAVPPQ